MSLGSAPRAVCALQVVQKLRSTQTPRAVGTFLLFPLLRLPPVLATSPWMKPRSTASSRKICLCSSSDSQFPWKYTGHDHPFTFKGFNLSPQNKFPFICWCLCIHQRGKCTECELGRAGTKELRSRRRQQYSWNAPFHLSTCIFSPVPASQGLFWQVLFCKLGFILFLLRKSQAKRSPTGIFWTAASPAVSALKMILQIFSVVLYTKKNINAGNTWNINKNIFLDADKFLLFFSGVCCIMINVL